jgi:hypothetical protein
MKRKRLFKDNGRERERERVRENSAVSDELGRRKRNGLI